MIFVCFVTNQYRKYLIRNAHVEYENYRPPLCANPDIVSETGQCKNVKLEAVAADVIQLKASSEE